MHGSQKTWSNIAAELKKKKKKRRQNAKKKKRTAAFSALQTGTKRSSLKAQECKGGVLNSSPFGCINSNPKNGETVISKVYQIN